MVEIQADEVGHFKDFFVAAGTELAAEGGVVEVGGFVELCLLGVLNAAEGACLLLGMAAGDVGVGICEGDALVGPRVGDGRLEKEKRGPRGFSSLRL